MKTRGETGATLQLRPLLLRTAWALTDLAVRPTASSRVLPDYLILGAQRAGTTSLQRVLSQHPDVTSPRLKKGVHYFDSSFDRGPLWYRSQFPLSFVVERHRRLTGDRRVTGEASPYYLFHPAIPGRIADLLPDIKMIAVLRDPIERAISQHKHELRRGFETLDLESALEAEAKRLEGQERLLMLDTKASSFAHRHHSYVARGQYANQIRRYFDHFSRDRLLILEAESFWESPVDTLAEVTAFLGIRLWHPDKYPQVNATKPSSIDPDLRGRLAEQFVESNAQLKSLTGRTFRWM